MGMISFIALGNLLLWAEYYFLKYFVFHFTGVSLTFLNLVSALGHQFSRSRKP